MSAMREDAARTARDVVSNARDTARDAASAARDTARDVASAARDTARDVADATRGGVARAADYARTQAARASDRATDLASDATETVEHWSAGARRAMLRVGDWISAHPLQVFAATIAAGYVLGLVLFRERDVEPPPPRRVRR